MSVPNSRQYQGFLDSCGTEELYWRARYWIIELEEMGRGVQPYRWGDPTSSGSNSLIVRGYPGYLVECNVLGVGALAEATTTTAS